MAKHLNHIDLNKNELQNAVLQVLGTAPSSPAIGQIYFDSSTNSVTWRNAANSAWVNPLARAAHTGTQAWSTITSTPTTLSGYGITDALTNSHAGAGGTAHALVVASGDAGFMSGTDKAKLDGIASGATANSSDTTLLNRANHTGTQAWSTITSTPTTLSGYGITDATPSSHIGSGGTAHANVTAGGAAGFMTGADKTKLDGIAAGATANSSDAALLNRSNHTGTQTASTISDFNTAVRTNRINEMATPNATVSMGNQVISNVANAVSGTDAPNLAQVQVLVDNARAALSVKDPVLVVAQANVNLSTPGSTIDGVAMSIGDRFLAPVQTTTTERGIWVWNGASAAATRPTDADNIGDIVDGSVVAVAQGTDAGKQFIQRATPSGAPGAWTQDWATYSVGGVSYTAGNGLTLTGSDFNVGAGTGISVTADTVAVDTSVVGRKINGLIGDGVTASIAFTHNLGNQWVIAAVYEVATSAQVFCDVVATSTNVVTFVFAAAPATNSLRVSVIG